MNYEFEKEGKFKKNINLYKNNCALCIVHSASKI
jgi:hypothetical protein